MVRSTHRSRSLLAALGAVTVVALAGCSGNTSSPATGPVAGTPSSSDSSSNSGSSSSSSSPTSVPAEVAVTPADGIEGVKPDQPVVVKAVTGALDTVTVKDDNNAQGQSATPTFTWEVRSS